MAALLSRTWLSYTLIFIFAFTLRFVFLQYAPSGVTPDEVHFLTHARALALTGSDLSGQWRPWLLEPIPGGESSEIPIIINAIFLKFLPYNLVNAKLFYSLIGAGIAILVGKVTAQLFNSRLGYIAALLMVINPWHIFVSRTAFDAPVGLFFILLSIYLLLKLNSRHLIWSFVPIFLAFYSYIGTKIILFPILLVTIIYKWNAYSAQARKISLILLGLTLLITIIYGFNALNSDRVQQGELISLSSPEIAETVNHYRQQTIQSPVTSLFYNKPTVALTQTINKYLGSFSTDVLFNFGDNDFRISLHRHGYLYFLDAVFIIVGLVWLARKHTKQLLFLLGLLLLAPIPDAIRSDPQAAYAFHSVLQYPIFIILASTGIYSINTLVPKYSKVSLLGILVLYFLSFTNFMFIYTHSYPLYASEATDFSHRVLARYVAMHQAESQFPLYIIHPEPEYVWRTLSLYNQHLSTSDIQKYRQSLNSDVRVWQNVTISNQVTNLPSHNQAAFVIHNSLDNLDHQPATHFQIPQLKDGGAVFRIYNPQACKPLVNRTFPDQITFNQLDIESLTKESFCQQFLTRPI